MPAITSYLRHLIVTGLTLLIAKMKLPLEGADKFADAIALLVIATITWAIVKYAPPGLSKFLGFSAFALLIGSGFTGCTEYPVTGSLMFRDAQSGAKAGLTFDPAGGPPKASVRVPIIDSQTGKTVGIADFTTTLPQKPKVIAEK